MTKQVIKWWQKFSFWDKIRMMLVSIGIGGEITLYFAESFPKWKIIAGIATVLSLGITYFFKDENKNGEVDIFEKE